MPRLDRRPGFLAALASLDRHDAAYLVAAKLDRPRSSLSRDAHHPLGKKWSPSSLSASSHPATPGAFVELDRALRRGPVPPGVSASQMTHPT